MTETNVAIISNLLNDLSSYDYQYLANSQGNIYAHDELINTINEVIAILKIAVDKKVIYALPASFQSRVTYSNISSIITVLTKFKNSVLENNITTLEEAVLQTQNYIHTYGLNYLLSKSISVEETTNLVLENNILNKSLKENTKKINELAQQTDDIIKNLIAFKNEKETELNQISINLKNSTLSAEQIIQTQQDILKIKSSIDTVHANSKATLDGQQDLIRKLKNDIENAEKSIKFINTESLSSTEETKIIREDLKSLHGEAKRIYNELEKLLNPAIAKDLQQTFRKRKIWLFRSSIVWGIIALIIALSLGRYIYLIFETDGFTFELEKVFVVFLKLLAPATILYFAINQYTVSRTLEEEYAFRESVATSLMAYAEQIKTDPNRKEELIKETCGLSQPRRYNPPSYP
ncbi:unnamed protein product [Rotaria sordida]|uniref:Uncharacterized protein n=1 Tax=Rotaria sordida TaxID=392033 RepID=A0A813UA81_9BILA|nr:unnamed protein product [Rotaria sordida]